MINIVKTPQEGSVAFNSSPIEIHIRSLKGSGHYFTMEILVDDEIYDIQQRSKLDDENCYINFGDQVQDVFTTDAIQVNTTEIVKKEDLIKRIDLRIQEYEQGTNTLVDQLELPYFNLINANNLGSFKIESLTALSIYEEYITIPLLGLVSFPFYTQGEFSIELFKNTESIWTQTSDSGEGVYCFNLRSIDFNFRKGDNVHFQITNTNTTIRRDFIFPLENGYLETALLLQNNYNAFEYFYCFGDLEETPNYKSYSLQLDKEIEKKYQTDVRVDYKLDTGYFHKDYLNPIQEIPQSLLLYLINQNELIEVRITNTKRTPSKQRKFLHNDTLSLSKNQVDEPDSTISYFTAPTLVNIIVEELENEPITISRQKFYDALSRSTPTEIVFPNSPEKGTLTAKVSGVNETVVPGKSYSYSNFESITLSGDGFGEPYLKFPFYIVTPVGQSNFANLVFNRIENNDLEAAPIISVAEYIDVFIDETSKTIVATITEPNNQDYTVQWAQIGGQSIAMSQTNTETLLLRDWASSGEYEFEIIAIDVKGNQTSKTTILRVMDYIVNLGFRKNEIIMQGGQPDSLMGLRIDFDVTRLTEDGNSVTSIYYNGGLSGDTKLMDIEAYNIGGFGISNVSDTKNQFYKFDSNGEILIPFTYSTTLDNAFLKSFVFNLRAQILIMNTPNVFGLNTMIDVSFDLDFLEIWA